MFLRSSSLLFLYFLILLGLILLILLKTRQKYKIVEENYLPHKKYKKAFLDVVKVLNEFQLEWWLTEGTLVAALRYGENFGKLFKFEQAVDSDIDIMVRAESQEQWEKLAPLIGQKLVNSGWEFFKLCHTGGQEEFADKLFVSYSKKPVVGPFDLHADIHMYQVDEEKNIAYTLDRCRNQSCENLYPFGNWGGSVPYKGFIVDERGKLGKCSHSGEKVYCSFKAIDFINKHGGEEYGNLETSIPNKKIKIFSREHTNREFSWDFSPNICKQDLYRIYYKSKDLDKKGAASYFNDIKKKIKLPCEDLTLVTSYFYVEKSKRIAREAREDFDGDKIYKIWMKSVLSYAGPMVIFTEKMSEEYITQLRDGLPTLIILTKLEDLKSYKYFGKMNERQNIDALQHIFEKGVDINSLGVIWNEKVNFLKIASGKNPYDTKYFAWIDIGYLRNGQTIPLAWPDPKKLKILDDSILIFYISDPSLLCRVPIVDHSEIDYENPPNGLLPTGGFFGGNAENIKKFHKLYYDKLEKKQREGVFIANDQYILSDIVCENRELFSPAQCEADDFVRNDRWFYAVPFFIKNGKKNPLVVHSVFILRDVIFFLENWIKYHKHIGVTKFYLYDNSQTGTRQNRLAGSESEGENKYGISTEKLFPYSEKNKEELRRICEKYPEITIVPWNPRGGDGKIIFAQAECVRDYNKKYADPNGWTAYIDIDEYITSDSLSGENFLKKILRRALIDGCSKITIKQKKFEDLFCQLEKPFSSIDNCLELDFDLLAHKNIVLNTTFKNLSTVHEISTKYGKQYIPEMSELRFNHYNLNKAGGKWIEDFFKKQNIISFKSKDNSLKAMEGLNFSLPAHLLDKDFYQKHTGKNCLFQE